MSMYKNIMAKPRKEGLSHTTIRIKWSDKEKLRSLAINSKEPDWSVLSRVLNIEPVQRESEIGVDITNPNV